MRPSFKTRTERQSPGTSGNQRTKKGRKKEAKTGENMIQPLKLIQDQDWSSWIMKNLLSNVWDSQSLRLNLWWFWDNWPNNGLSRQLEPMNRIQSQKSQTPSSLPALHSQYVVGLTDSQSIKLSVCFHRCISWYHGISRYIVYILPILPQCAPYILPIMPP